MVAQQEAGTDTMTPGEDRWAKSKRLLERFGIVAASTDSAECGYHVSGRDWPSEDFELSFDEVHRALVGLEHSSEAAVASLARVQAPNACDDQHVIDNPSASPPR
jgi:hypothetical protein